MIAPERVAVSSFGRRRSLSDLAVWGFPEISRKIFPLKPSFPFSPLFLPSTFSFISFTPQTPPSNSLEQAYSPFLPLLPSFSSSDPFLFPFSLFLGPYQTLSKHLRNPSIGSSKGPKNP